MPILHHASQEKKEIIKVILKPTSKKIIKVILKPTSKKIIKVILKPTSKINSRLDKELQ